MRSSKLRRLRTLSFDDARILIAALVDLTVISIGLRILGFQRVLRWMQASSAPSRLPLEIEVVRKARRYARLIQMASRHHLVRAECLQRSLVLHAWLRRDGLPSELRIGVRKDGDQFLAHAWIELDGCVVNDSPRMIAAFTPLFMGDAIHALNRATIAS